MKKSVFITVSLFFSLSILYGQISTEEEPISFGRSISALSFGQETTTNSEVVEKDKKVSYVFIVEHGMYLGFNIAYTDVFVNGICFNKTQDIIGIGVGAEFDIMDRLSIPIFANYRYYFQSKTNLKPLINIAIGTRLTSWYSYEHSHPIRTWKPDFYSTIASGFRVKGFSFTSGLFVKSFKNLFFGGIEIKLGYIFIHSKKAEQ